ncbi:hypothetical protein ABVF11_02390 [Pediococcus argentinicus]|uniref:hypothetical protein n=1 Tax=Pediococcus argentinicus TaxID=480391 RepID=UPI00338FEC25
MAKGFDWSEDSPTQLKLGDTTTKLGFQLTLDGNNFDLTNVTGITVKVGDSSHKEVGELAVDLTKIETPEAGQFQLLFTGDVVKKLTTGEYDLEAWIIDANGTSIFPSDGFLQLSINPSIGSD